MQLVYHALESDHPEVQEKGLRTIPTLLDGLDVGTVQDVLFVQVAILFTKTRILSGPSSSSLLSPSSPLAGD